MNIGHTRTAVGVTAVHLNRLPHGQAWAEGVPGLGHVWGMGRSYCRLVSLFSDDEPLPDFNGLFPYHEWSGVLGPLIGDRFPADSAALGPVVPVPAGGLVIGAVEGLLPFRPPSDCGWPSGDCCANDIELVSTSAVATNIAIFIQASRDETDDTDSAGGARASCPRGHATPSRVRLEAEPQ
jgi:hypothetical protein